MQGHLDDLAFRPLTHRSLGAPRSYRQGFQALPSGPRALPQVRPLAEEALDSAHGCRNPHFAGQKKGLILGKQGASKSPYYTGLEVPTLIWALLDQ